MTDELICEEENGLEAECPVTKVEEVLEGGAEEVKHHGIVITLGAEPSDNWHTYAAGKDFVDLGLVLELGLFGLGGLELDSDLLTGDDIYPEINIT
jgi:hypothetical protein